MLVVRVKNRNMALVTAAVCLLATTAVLAMVSPASRRLALGVRPGVILSGQNVGGLYPDELRQVILSISETVERSPQNAIYYSETGEVVNERLGISLDVDATVDAVMAAARCASVEPSLRAVVPAVTATMLKPVYGVNTSRQLVALAFNVAWGEEYLPDILAALDAAGARSTFFITGTWAKQFPNMVSAIKEEGHEIANHGWNHPHPKALTDSDLEKLIADNEALLREITGARTVLFAPPYGEVDQHIAGVAARMGYTTVMWTVDTIDWQRPAPAVVAERALARLAPGNIVLMHPTEPTARALGGILAQLKQKGFSAVTVSELLRSGSARHQ